MFPCKPPPRSGPAFCSIAARMKRRHRGSRPCTPYEQVTTEPMGQDSKGSTRCYLTSKDFSHSKFSLRHSHAQMQQENKKLVLRRRSQRQSWCSAKARPGIGPGHSPRSLRPQDQASPSIWEFFDQHIPLILKSPCFITSHLGQTDSFLLPPIAQASPWPVETSSTSGHENRSAVGRNPEWRSEAGTWKKLVWGAHAVPFTGSWDRSRPRLAPIAGLHMRRSYPASG